MTVLNNEKLIEFIDDIIRCDIEEIADEFGDGTLLNAIENNKFYADTIFEYIYNKSKADSEFYLKLYEIINVNDNINKAIGLISDATGILTEYNYRFDNSADYAIEAFFENTTHHPQRMFIELIEGSLK